MTPADASARGGSLVWISGASAGIGAALAATVPFSPVRVVDLSRRGGTPGTEHFRADLSDPADWARVAEHFTTELADFRGDRVVFVHNAGTVAPIGPTDEVGSAAYTAAVLLNSAAPQVLGQAFLQASAGVQAERQLVMLSSGAARKPYPGWSAYNAGKAAVEHWVRTVGAETGDYRVIAVAPGVVDTAMQAEIRAVDERAFPAVERFRQLRSTGGLTSPEEAARGIWALVDRRLDSGTVVDLREPPAS